MTTARGAGSAGTSEALSLAVARRVALAAQGFGVTRPPGPIVEAHLRGVLGRLGLLQIDSVNVLARAHYLPLFSRLGAYSPDLLDRAAWGRPRRVFEYWAHEASLLPFSAHPLLRWRMARAGRGEGVWGALKPFAGERRREAEAILARIAAEGPLAASDIETGSRKSGWWSWDDTKRALEWLFWAGKLTTAYRRNAFERVYDLPERVLPKQVLATPTPTEADAHRALLAIAARALGVATGRDLRDYFRLAPDDTGPRLAELVEAGTLLPVRVEGWTQKAYLHAEARHPRRIGARALVAPFDPLIWERSRTERLFGVRYRVEIYTPVHRRVHGYYVLPFLLDERLVARVDLKADRQARLLRVQGAYAEPGAPAGVAEHLAAELTTMCRWLGLEGVSATGRGDLSAALNDRLACP